MNKFKILEYVLTNEPEKVPLEYWDDKQFVFYATHWNGFNFKYASDNLKKNKEFILKVIKYWGTVFKYVHSSIKKDKEFILQAVAYNVSILKYLSNNLRNDKQLLIKTTQVCKNAGVYFDIKVI